MLFIITMFTPAPVMFSSNQFGSQFHPRIPRVLYRVYNDAFAQSSIKPGTRAVNTGIVCTGHRGYERLNGLKNYKRIKTVQKIIAGGVQYSNIVSGQTGDEW